MRFVFAQGVWKEVENGAATSLDAGSREIYLEQLIVLIMSSPVAQMVEHGASNAKIMGSIPRESKSW